MKRDLLFAGILILAAGASVGVVAGWYALQRDDDAPALIKPRTEKIAQLPKKPAEVKAALVSERKPPVVTPPIKKPESKKVRETKAPDPVEAAPNKVEPKLEVKIEPKKDIQPTAKVIAFDPLYRLNDPEGEYIVKTLNRGKEIELIGVIKTLKIAGLNEGSAIDATKLVANEVIFIGNVNGVSKVTLGKTKKLTIRDVNDRSLVDASAAEAIQVIVEGSINSGSTVKFGAGGGSVEFLGAINDRAQIEVAAAGGKVTFKGPTDSAINGGAKLTITAQAVGFAGAINGPDTRINVTLTRQGTLKFRRLTGGVSLFYRKADAGDPAPRIDAGQVDGRAVLRELPAGKR